MSFYEEEIFANTRYPNFNLKSYLKDLEIEYRSHDSEDHEEVAINCPKCVERGEDSHDTKKKCWINEEEGRYFCYRCKWGGTMPYLIRTLSNTSMDDALKILRGTTLDPMEHLSLKLWDDEVTWNEEDFDVPTIELPYGYKQMSEPHPYLIRRGIPWSHAERNSWGYCDVGFCVGRIIVPTFMEDRLVFWQARATWESDDKDFKKVLNPRGVSARKVLYNYDGAKEEEILVLTEGFTDCVKVGTNGMATNGKNLHPQQLDWLERTKAKTIIMAWDRDSWTDGTKKKECSIKRAADMLKMKFEVLGAEFPEGRDAGSYEYKSPELLRILDKAKPL
jgi:hypothetical protein